MLYTVKGKFAPNGSAKTVELRFPSEIPVSHMHYARVVCCSLNDEAKKLRFTISANIACYNHSKQQLLCYHTDSKAHSSFVQLIAGIYNSITFSIDIDSDMVEYSEALTDIVVLFEIIDRRALMM